jgi:beta-phosphoglucomutase-like phosphatase (HAD superfamily)
MNAPDDDVFLLDCDNTLLDNDRMPDDLRTHFASEFGPESRDQYWEVFEALRAAPGYADALGASLRRRRGALNDPRLLQIAYPLADPVIEEYIGDRLTYDFPAWLRPARAIDAE